MGDATSQLGGSGYARDPRPTPAIFKRMMEADAAPFESLQPDPWPKVHEMLLAAAWPTP